MKEKKYENDFGTGVGSILDTNSAKMTEEELALEQKPRVAGKQIWKSVAPILLAIVIVIGVLFGGGLISEHQRKKEEAKLPREGFMTRYNAAPEVVSGELGRGVTEIYYSRENGMSVTLAFANGYDKEVAITAVEMVLTNEAGKRIASAKTELKKVVVPAGEVLEHRLYLEPHLVEINDDKLEKFNCDLTVTEEK